MKSVIRLLLLATVSCLLFTAAAAQDAANPEYTAGYYTYMVNEDGNAVITGYSGNESAASVPYAPDGYTVVGIGYGVFANCYSLKSVALPDTLQFIGDWAFASSSLTSIDLPAGLLSIGEGAFLNCGSLQSITLPEGLKSIGSDAFNNCSMLESISLPDSLVSIGDGAFAVCNFTTPIKVSPNHPVFSVTEGALFNDVDKTLIYYPVGATEAEYVVPDGMQAIGNSAFAYCFSLETVSLPDSLQSIGTEAFSACTSLQSITLPSSLQTIGDRAFTLTLALASIDAAPGNPIYSSKDGVLFRTADNALVVYPAGNKTSKYSVPQGTQAIGDQAFTYSTSLTSVTLPDSLQSIGDYAFQNCERLKSITLPDGLTSIGDGLFSDCYALASVTLPDTLRSIGEGVFSACSSLKSIALPDGLETIGSSAFYGCSALKTISLPDSLQSIGYGAFSVCKALTAFKASPEHPVFSVIDGVLFSRADNTLISYPAGKTTAKYSVPEGVASIGDSAMTECRKLKSVTLPDSVVSIGYNAFYNCGALQSITVSPDNPSFSSIDGVLFNKAGTGLIFYPSAKTTEKYGVPQGVETIGSDLFASCDSLKSLSTPGSLVSIGDFTFNDCPSLTSVSIAEGLQSIGSWAFYNCNKLKTVNLPESLRFIDHGAFQECGKLTLTVPEGSYAQTYAEENGIPYQLSGN